MKFKVIFLSNNITGSGLFNIYIVLVFLLLSSIEQIISILLSLILELFTQLILVLITSSEYLTSKLNFISPIFKSLVSPINLLFIILK